MKKVIALGGSNSRQSVNKAFADFVANQLAEVQVKVLDLNDFILPLFSPDLQAKQGIPEKATKINELLQHADGLVISLAEYKGAYTPAFKDMFDWVSGVDKKVWKDKPLLLMVASLGGRGGKNVLNTALELFLYK